MGLTVNIVQFGKKDEVEVEDGSTFGDVLSKIPNGENLDVRVGGRPIQEKRNERVRGGERLTAAPRQVKQGL